MDVDIDHLRTWIGRRETADDVVTAGQAAGLAAMLDRDDLWRNGEGPAEGEALPPGWHWLYALPRALQSDLGPDGHPRRGAFVPPVPLPRRMWAADRMSFPRPLRVGERITRFSEIADVSLKQGRSGPLVFVVARHEFFGPDGRRAVEEHDIVYRDAAKGGAKVPAPGKAPGGEAWRRVVTPDPVLLFRFSALTFNGHRIHYDHPYATGTEGYPGLIVHGPLLAILLLDLIAREAPEAVVTSFDFRARTPVFDTAPFAVCGTPAEDDSGARLWVEGPDGELAMTAEAGFEA